jgi:hypothetical protein
MKRNQHRSLIYFVLLSLAVIGGCQCNNCKENRVALIDTFRFVQIDNPANGSNQCDYEHTIGINEGGNPCLVTIVGLDGWGIDDLGSAVQAEVTGPDEFTIADTAVLEGRSGPACSGWTYLKVSGDGRLSGNMLQLNLTFADTTGQYNSGMMQYTYQRE